MKERYVKPEIEFITFGDNSDIITCSGEPHGPMDDGPIAPPPGPGPHPGPGPGHHPGPGPGGRP